MVETGSTFLALEVVLQFTCVGDGHCFARPSEEPRTFAFGPFGNAFIVLTHALFHVFGDADVEFPVGILNHVDLIHVTGFLWRSSAAELVAGAGFEPATFRL